MPARSQTPLVSVLCGWALACCTGSALAQTGATAIDDARQNARLRLGGLLVTPTIQLKELGFDSNVFNQAGEQSPDFTATLTPTAQIALPIGRRALVTSRFEADLVYYQKYSNQRSVNPNVSLRGEVFLQRLSVFTSASFLNTRLRVNQEIDARARRIDRSLDAGFNLRVRPKLSLGLSGHLGRLEYGSDQFFRNVRLQDALANDLRSVAASVNYKATPKTTFFLRGDAGQYRFLFSPVKDADSFRITPGVEFQPRALISGTAAVGLRQFKPLNPLVPKFRGAVAALQLSYSLRSATRFTVTLDRDMAYSYQDAESYYVSTAVGLSVRRQLVGPFDATVGTQRFRSDYRDSLTSSTSAGSPRVDMTRNYSADIGYRLGRKGRIGVGVSYWDRDSNRAEEVAYNGLRVGSTVSYGF